MKPVVKMGWLGGGVAMAGAAMVSGSVNAQKMSDMKMSGSKMSGGKMGMMKESAQMRRADRDMLMRTLSEEKPKSPN